MPGDKTITKLAVMAIIKRITQANRVCLNLIVNILYQKPLIYEIFTKGKLDNSVSHITESIHLFFIHMIFMQKISK